MLASSLTPFLSQILLLVPRPSHLQHGWFHTKVFPYLIAMLQRKVYFVGYNVQAFLLGIFNFSLNKYFFKHRFTFFLLSRLSHAASRARNDVPIHLLRFLPEPEVGVTVHLSRTLPVENISVSVHLLMILPVTRVGVPVHLFYVPACYNPSACYCFPVTMAGVTVHLFRTLLSAYSVDVTDHLLMAITVTGVGVTIHL